MNVIEELENWLVGRLTNVKPNSLFFKNKDDKPFYYKFRNPKNYLVVNVDNILKWYRVYKPNIVLPKCIGGYDFNKIEDYLLEHITPILKKHEVKLIYFQSNDNTVFEYEYNKKTGLYHFKTAVRHLT